MLEHLGQNISPKCEYYYNISIRLMSLLRLRVTQHDTITTIQLLGVKLNINLIVSTSTITNKSY